MISAGATAIVGGTPSRNLSHGAGPSSGVVGRDLKVFGTENLYVCDGSVSDDRKCELDAHGRRARIRLAQHLGDRIVRADPATTSSCGAPKIALTGASGFIGRNFVAEYAGRGRQSCGARSRCVVVAADEQRQCPLLAGSTMPRRWHGASRAVTRWCISPTSGDPTWNLAALRSSGRGGASGRRAPDRACQHHLGLRLSRTSACLIEQDERARTNDEYSVVKRRLEAEFATLVAHHGLCGLILQPTIVDGWPGNWTGNAADLAKHERAVLPEAGRGLVQCRACRRRRCRHLPRGDRAGRDPGRRGGRALLSSPAGARDLGGVYTEHATMLRRLGLPEQLRIKLSTCHGPHNDWNRNRSIAACTRAAPAGWLRP